MKQAIDLMTGHPSRGPDQLPVKPRNEFQEITAGLLAAAAFCIGSTLSPGVAAPRPESVTVIEIETSALIPQPRAPQILGKKIRSTAQRRR